MAAATELAEPKLAGRYRFVRELGRGASGRVILAADDAESGALRAIKLVRAEDAERLAWELRLLARIAHPNVARVFELLRVAAPVAGAFRLERGAAALVEEHAEGRRADQVALDRRDDPQARVALALAVGAAAARALAAIHGAGLIHGDVKPQNLVVGDDPEATKLVDLGLARPPGRTSTVSGTLGYLAPEAWRGERTPATDLYALGATLHTLLRSGTKEDGDADAARAARREASGGSSEMSADASRDLSRALAGPAAREPLPASVPAPLARLIAALLDPDPARRPASAREVAARLVAIGFDQTREPGADRTSGVALGDAGGAADAATPAERAYAMTALARAGDSAEVASLARALGDGGLIVLHGPRGAGRTRLVADAVQQLQLARSAAGATVPTYRRTVATLPAAVPLHDTVLHVEDADGIAIAEARTLLDATRVAGAALSIVLERAVPLEAADRAVPSEAEIAVGPLAPAELAALLHAALGTAPSPAVVEAARAASGGLAGRLCRIMAEGYAAGLDPSRPTTLRELGAHTAAGEETPVPDRARSLAEVLAVAGGALDEPTARNAIERDAGGDAAALERVDAAQVLITVGAASIEPDGRLALRPDIAVALRARVPGPQRRAIAERLNARVVDPVARGHVRAALDDPEGAARAFFEAITERRRRGDPEGAARLAQTATDAIAGASPDVRERFAVARADALRATGRYGAAAAELAPIPGARARVLEADLLRLLGRPHEGLALLAPVLGTATDPATATATATVLSARAIRARIYLDTGQLDLAAADAQQVVAAAGETEDLAGIAARASEVLALVALYRGDPDAASTAAARATALAARAGDRAAEARGLSLQASVGLARGDVRWAAERFVRAFELADAAGEMHAAASFLVNVGLARLDAGEPGPAIAALRDGARRLARLGRDRDLARALYNLGNAASLVGDDDLALAAVRRAQETALRAGDASAAAFATVIEAEIALRGGEPARALALIGPARAPSVPSATGLQPRDAAVVAARRAIVLAACGAIVEAKAAVAEASVAAAEDGGDLSAAEHEIALARVALAAGDPGAAAAAAGAAVARGDRLAAFETRLRGLLVGAEAAEAAGHRDDAVRRLASARALLDTAAETLPLDSRARLRAVPAYRRALAAVPAERVDPELRDARWRRLSALAKRLGAERRIGRLQEEIVDAAIELTGAERGALVTREEDGTLRVRAARALGRGTLPLEERGFSRSIVARAIDDGRGIATVDAARDERLDAAASVHALAIRSVLAVPLRLRGVLGGAIVLEDRLRPAAFAGDDLVLLSDLADLASIALDGAELLRTERRTARHLRALRARLARTVETQALELATLRRSAGEGTSFPGIIGRSEPMRRVLDLVERVAPSEVPVLITGESGTGKELIARAIHTHGVRRDGPFISESCGAIPEPLLESTLFGHVRGAFTGADRARIGLFEAAHGGTLFLDEIGEMSPAMQAKLLRVLQERELRPVGSERTRKVDVRVVSATHRDLSERVAQGHFREDLYYRLAVVTLELPPLRERRDDVEPLIAHFATKHARGRPVRIDRSALALLTSSPWPGNVRQLENEVQRALVLAPDGVVRDEHLSPALRESASGGAAADELDLKGQQDALERRLIQRALDRSGSNQTRAAKLLGVSRFGLQKMIKRLGL